MLLDINPLLRGEYPSKIPHAFTRVQLTKPFNRLIINYFFRVIHSFIHSCVCAHMLKKPFAEPLSLIILYSKHYHTTFNIINKQVCFTLPLKSSNHSTFKNHIHNIIIYNIMKIRHITI